MLVSVSTREVDFGVVKLGYAYQSHVTLSNACRNCLRWRLSTSGKTIEMVRCVTPPGRLPPGISVRLIFELQAVRSGRFSFSFHITACEDESARQCAVDIQSTVVVVGAKEFRGHDCRTRFERKPLLARGVQCVGKIPSSRVRTPQREAPPPATPNPDEDDAPQKTALPPEALDVLNAQSDEEADELASLPSFPGSVYDPRTRRVFLDSPQLVVAVDPAQDLQVLVESQRHVREARMTFLEQGGLLTSRALADIRNARLKPPASF
ncbi:hypothetical protein CTAYLR_005843 [Chrysophaeum taylorii]|uniref:Uncharacterized protein n=1 Tax=Chrysophaeum taylorii TaxID=2483200 RepID=A0AAD7XRZ3_9STRA|nr:hypothetical protein CTAYLR_005843 [Chrysophaeum taylorii]